MATPTIIISIILIVDGVIGYLLGQPNPETGNVSKTALIPIFFGLPIFFCGLIARNEKFRKHAMHLAVMIGFLGFIGAGMRVPKSIVALNENPDGSPLALISQTVMAIVCLVFVILCVRSFIQARKAKSQ